MTNVYVEIDADRHFLSLDGHASGNDAVCAAVSGLVFALAGYLTNLETAQGLEISLDSGKARIRCTGGERIYTAFELVVIGLRQIEQQYPNLVRVEFAK